MTKQRFALILFGSLTGGILAMAAIYPLGFAGILDLKSVFPPEGPFNALQAHFMARVAAKDWAFLAHILGGMLALATGPFQFWEKLRRERLGLHRKLGFAYFTGVFVGGLGGLLAARTAWGGAPAQMGFSLLALLWLGASGQGLGHILKGKVAQHQAWMRLSYGLTLAAISLRIQMPLLALVGLPEVLTYQTVAWSSWVPQVIWWLGWGRRS